MNTSRQQPRVELPELDAGLTLVDIDSDLGVTPVQSLLFDCVFAGTGGAYWVDAAGTVQTTRLRELAPDRRYLDRIHVARGFTAYQQTSLLDRLAGEHVTNPSVVVATGIDRLYRDSDVSTPHAQELLVRSIAALARVGRVHDVPVIVTRSRDDEFTEPVVNAAKTQLHCRDTQFGPRFTDAAGDVDALVYHLADGWVQTTLAYWQEVLAHRAQMHDAPVVSEETAPQIS
ncbi:hypothetical protein [Halorubrum kocurii]|uniref:Uncharacterized protein n=1 Tax=Halorubrum kocurii JCM 14978 TaxID=1230456 RepID=M0P6X8_9EURY|nr:hypothetical protein [Halorubrum kocurii]EMA65907.1 hypothetical protein C468_05241 [Halorubrum kocurii JCM 14978]